ncbi:MAG: Uma2 family endonuclease [Blastocatellia bacterium]
MSTNPIKYYSLKEYFEIEKISDIKHEYVYGEIFSMVGASKNHLRIATNITRRLENQFDFTTCETLGSDTRVKINDNLYRYPDVSVACNAQFEVMEGLDTLINPILIIEILSKSTARYDRDTKFREYQQINTLRYYLLISQNEFLTVLFTKQPNNTWTSETFSNLEDVIDFPIINCRLVTHQIYSRINFE